MRTVIILFLIFDAVIKLIPIAPVINSMAEFGYPPVRAWPEASARPRCCAPCSTRGRAAPCSARS